MDDVMSVASGCDGKECDNYIHAATATTLYAYGANTGRSGV